MTPAEGLATRLEARLSEAGISSRIKRVDPDYRVDTLSVGDRRALIRCVWRENDIRALALGMNPANDRCRLGRRQPRPAGPEFVVTLLSERTTPVHGETSIEQEVMDGVRAWLSGASLDTVVQAAPFIDRIPRETRALAARLDSRLRWEIDAGSKGELWVYGGQRACRVSDLTCAFYIGQAQVAFTERPRDASGDIAAWLVDQVPVERLAERGVELERHAEVLAVDPARWHWLHVRDRIADPRDALFELAPLIEILADSPVASRFFTYSSLDRLCFSASSHFPWVGMYPIVSYWGNDQYDVGGASCTLQEAVARIERMLAASEVQPFFGAAPDHELPIINRSLAEHGSSLRAEIVRSGFYSGVWLVAGARRCRVYLRGLDCIEQSARLAAECGTTDGAVRVAIRFLTEPVAFEDLAADPAIMRFTFFGG